MAWGIRLADLRLEQQRLLAFRSAQPLRDRTLRRSLPSAMCHCDDFQLLRNEDAPSSVKQNELRLE